MMDENRENGVNGRKNVLIIGMGVSGLSCALEFLKSSEWNIHLVSEFDCFHTSTCSQGAGGLWMPFHIEPEHLSTKWATDTLYKYLNQYENTTNSIQYPIEMCNVATFIKDSTTKSFPEWTKIPELQFQVLSSHEILEKYPDFHFPSGFSHASLFKTPVIHAEKYLELMLNELTANQVKIHSGIHLNSLQDAYNLGKQCFAGTNQHFVIVNCSGLGSNALCADESVIPGRGVVLVAERPLDLYDFVLQCEESPFSDSFPGYIIPRGRELVTIGGTYLENDWTLNPSESEVQQVLDRASILLPSIKNVSVKYTWNGLRPVRHSGVRIEVERIDVTRKDQSNSDDSEKESFHVVHNYGHGGSGWTVMYGCAAEVKRLADEIEFR